MGYPDFGPEEKSMCEETALHEVSKLYVKSHKISKIPVKFLQKYMYLKIFVPNSKVYNCKVHLPKGFFLSRYLSELRNAN